MPELAIGQQGAAAVTSAAPRWLAAQITARLQQRLGDRRIDVLVVDPDTELEPVHRVAQAEGVLLQT